MKPVYFVGAGPGDPELITIKGKHLLSQADVVIYTNSLIPAPILQYCRSNAQVIPSLELSLEEITNFMINCATSNQLVVRLHDGDPSIFSTIGEQIDRLLAASIPVEVVPGVSAFQLAAARLQVELTIPELVQTIILTRVSAKNKVPDREALRELAKHQATICLYLSAKQIEIATAELLTAYPPSTPVAICYHLGWQDEKIVTTKLENMAVVSRTMQLERSALYVISPALHYRGNRSALYQKSTFLPQQFQ
ncbi:MAG: precorrin-4 C(11)-methyltransferase [Pseudanabaenaceae cyanobacterium SKYGB_i_bin29]|nr:precorrin-4 C(11)-methyltransferase [Pseudanabaenaceae cyanobacterium SKYG29]MDW8421090.1 precorrin-4 C(11)-methyltransferase [Pseudanabaenaceae cyanobacterium SKYGB_i_bin29]